MCLQEIVDGQMGPQIQQAGDPPVAEGCIPSVEHMPPQRRAGSAAAAAARGSAAHLFFQQRQQHVEATSCPHLVPAARPAVRCSSREAAVARQVVRTRALLNTYIQAIGSRCCRCTLTLVHKTHQSRRAARLPDFG
jgi:hypothetical protein